MGENGVGKSTLIRHFHRPGATPGRQGGPAGPQHLGVTVAAAAHKLRLDGQNPNNFFVLKDTVAEEIAFTLDALGITGERREASLTGGIRR